MTTKKEKEESEKIKESCFWGRKRQVNRN